MPWPAPRAQRAEYCCAARSCVVSAAAAAGRGPFLDAREIVVGAVAVLPHRETERGIALRLVLEFADQPFELGARFVGGVIRKLRRVAAIDFQFDRLFLAGRRVAAEPDVDQFA